jgi:hypothetical protein
MNVKSGFSSAGHVAVHVNKTTTLAAQARREEQTMDLPPCHVYPDSTLLTRTSRYERLGDDVRALVDDVVLDGAYHDPIDLAKWYGDDRIRDLATAWGQAGRVGSGG